MLSISVQVSRRLFTPPFPGIDMDQLKAELPFYIGVAFAIYCVVRYVYGA